MPDGQKLAVQISAVAR